MPPRTLDLLVLPHTHWDREWYHAAPRFQQRLVALVDARLADPEAPPFLLDGQVIPLEDYLAVRPDRVGAVAAALADGRLDAGPWYVLADLLIPSAESAIRNLLTGRRLLRRLGAGPPPVWYAPDAFGHPAWAPTLAAGFGFGLAIVWRGYGGSGWPSGDAAWWEGADGARVLLHHLPTDGYEFGSALPMDGAAMAVRARHVDGVLRPRATLGATLLTVGADHHAPAPDLPTAIDRLAEQLAPLGWRVRPARLAEVAHALAHAAQREAGRVPLVTGELRRSEDWTWALQGTFATRTAQKRRHARLERRLLHQVEPWAAMAWARRGADRHEPRPDGQVGAAQLPALLDAAWRTLLEGQPHDTLCGCSIDAVATALDARLDALDTQLDGLEEAAIDALLGVDRPALRRAPAAWRPSLVWCNALPWPRAGIARVELVRHLTDEPVGPGSAGRRPAVDVLPPVPHALAGAGVVQHVRRRVARERIESPQHYPDNDLVVIDDLLVLAPEMPAMGCRLTAAEPVAPSPPSGGAAVRAVDDAGDLRLEAGALEVRWTGPALEVRDGASGRRWGLDLMLQDVQDAGDCYTPSPRGRATRATWGASIVRERGPWRASVERAVRVAAPRGTHGPLRAVITLSVEARSRALRLDIRGENARTDHRLRLQCTLARQHRTVRAHDGLGATERGAAPAPHRGARERPSGLAPMHRWVHAAHDGLLFVADGLPEVELRALPGGRSALAFTVVRAVGELSRSDLPERPGHAGWPAPTPGAQELGPFAATLWIVPSPAGPDAAATEAALDDAACDRLALELLCPLTATTRRAAVDLPSHVEGIHLDGPAFSPCAIKPSEDGRALVLRCVNLLDAPAAGRWHVPLPWRAAQAARLDETPIAPLEGDATGIPFVAAPREVVTVRLELPDASAGG